MVFSSHIFIFYFLPVALALYYAVPRSLRMPVLTLTSYAFYGWTNPWFVLLILWSTLVDFCCGNLIYGHWRLIGPLMHDDDGEPVASPGAAEDLPGRVTGQQPGDALLLQVLHVRRRQPQPDAGALRQAGNGDPGRAPSRRNLVLHVRVDQLQSWTSTTAGPSPRVSGCCAPSRKAGACARGFWTRLKLELQALNAFACYITQFPHLVAGPIIRYQDLERQLHERSHTVEKFGRGIFFFALGLGKKILIANPVGELADAAFRADSLHWLDAWYGVFGYAFQIYFDFSGYSDMAIGLGLMFGFEFAKNFDSPYKSQSITEFWRRWHISLSTWLRDYLYIPLGGNRKGEVRTYLNLMVVMLLGGFWHGASWNFLVWGAIFGVWLAFERLLGKSSIYARLPGAIAGGTDLPDREPRLGVLPGGRPLRGEPLSLVALQSRRQARVPTRSCSAPFFMNPAMSWS